tara:strand:- start:126 stop:827 length:702 start_codon:yes stop_codon:yes gene_type:complete
MTSQIRPHSAVAEYVSEPGTGHLVVRGTTVPTAATAGYAPSCLFQKTDGSAGATLYVNQGSLASCSFVALPDFTGLLATVAELNRAADASTKIVDCTASTLAVTEALHDKKTIVLDRAAGIAVTLPVASAGLQFEFLVKTTFTSAASIKSVAGTDIMIGHAIMGNNADNSVVNWQAVAADTFDTINLLGTSNSTGGMAGQRIRITGLAAALWYVEIIGDAAGTEATPFENTVA